MSSSFRVISFDSARRPDRVRGVPSAGRRKAHHTSRAGVRSPGASVVDGTPSGSARGRRNLDGFRPEAGPVLVGHGVKMSDITETEQKYGIAPKRGTGVIYQDQVVLMEHGDKAVKTWNTNGIEWTLDGSDPQVTRCRRDRSCSRRAAASVACSSSRARAPTSPSSSARCSSPI